MHLKPSIGTVGLVVPVLTDISFALLLGAAVIGIVRAVRHRRGFAPSAAVAVTMWAAATAFLTLRPGHSGRLNLVPFNFGSAATPFEPVSNVLLFIPLGIVVATLGWRWFVVLVVGLALSLAIETTQYLVNEGRTADVDDLIENTAGAVLGWAVALAVRRGP
jgi:glycopeptide antibiotics resistance protein